MECKVLQIKHIKHNLNSEWGKSIPKHYHLHFNGHFKVNLNWLVLS